MLAGVLVWRYPAPPPGNGFAGYVWEYGYSLAAMFFISLLVCVRPGFDVLHTANPPDTAVFLAAFYKLFGKRFVYDQHDLAPEMYYARFSGKGNRHVHRALLWLEALSCRLADRVIVTNQSGRMLMMQRGRVPPEHIAVVRNGPSSSRFRLVEPDPALLKPGKTVIVYVGIIGPQDGVDYLLRSLWHLAYELGRQDFFCYVVGSGDALPGLKALAEQLKLADYVLFTDWVDQAEVVRYLSSADICAAPEPSNEYNDRSTMIKMMEYMAVGKPIVSFDLPEHRVSAGGAARYAQPNDELEYARQIAALMDDPVQRKEMGRIGKERIEMELAWSYQEERLLAVYRELAPAKPA